MKARSRIDTKLELGIILIYIICVVYIRGRVSEDGPLPFWTTRRRYQFVRWMLEAGFTRADLYRSGPHVGSTILQRRKFPVLSKGKTYGDARCSMGSAEGSVFHGKANASGSAYICYLEGSS